MKNKVRSIYKNREEFIVLGLTGKTGSGCSTVADILKNGYKEYNPVDCNLTDIQSRKAEIIKKFASKNFIDDDKKFKEEMNMFLKSFVIFSRDSKIYQFLKRLKNNAK